VRVVVTGGAGFIGANLCATLSDEGHDVIALDDLSTGRASNLDGLAVKLVEGSILDRPLVRDVLDGSDAVVHLAARGSVPRSLAHPVATHEVNATGTTEVLAAARAAGVGHVVLSSSSSVYGANPALPKHEGLVPSPVSPYAASKLAAEVTALAYQRSYGLPVLAFRFFNVFGPLQPADHDYAAVVPRFIDAALTGRPAEVHGDGEQSRDFTYVGTVVRMLADALERTVTADGPVNLAFGSRISLLEVLAELERVLGHPVKRFHVDPRPGDVRHSQADAAHLRSLFPTIGPVPFSEGLARTVAWFQER
jgi:UDP-glucose 4-epimerase